PKTTSVTIIAAFHMTGAVYESRKRRWLFSTPRHHAERTSRPAPGNRMRTSRIVSSRSSPSNPGAMASMRTGVATTPTRTMALTGRRRRAYSNILIGDGLAERSARFLHQIRLDERIEVAVEHAVGVADLLLGPVILHHAVRRQHVAPNLVAERDVLLDAADLR